MCVAILAMQRKEDAEMSDTNLDLAMRVLERRIEVLESAVGPSYVKSVPQTEPKQPKYEYEYREVKHTDCIARREYLNNMASVGWRLITASVGHYHTLFIFEREITT